MALAIPLVSLFPPRSRHADPVTQEKRIILQVRGFAGGFLAASLTSE